MKYFSVKNFDKFQRFKDRQPSWIKLYTSLLVDHDFESLPEITQLHLIKIWVLASSLANRLPFDVEWVSHKIGGKADLYLLAQSGFIVGINGESLTRNNRDWKYQRHRDFIFMLDNYKCCYCGAEKDLTLDHIISLKKGGSPNDSHNLLTACRPCNSKKFTKNLSDDALKTLFDVNKRHNLISKYLQKVFLTDCKDYMFLSTQNESSDGQRREENINLEEKRREEVETEEQWLSALRRNPAYSSLDIENEFNKMRGWCEVNKKQPTKRRFINWLNRADKPMSRLKSMSGFEKTMINLAELEEENRVKRESFSGGN